jgi:hypothetical protein
MAGTVVETLTQYRNNKLIVWELVLSWTGSSSDGTVPSTAISSATIGKISGTYLFLVKTVPGTTAPTALYDIVLNDSDGLDVLGGVAADRSASAVEKAVPKQYTGQSIYGGVFIDSGGLTFVLTNNSVVSATGKVKLYFS